MPAPAAPLRIVVASNPHAAFGRNVGAGTEVAALLRSHGFAVVHCVAVDYPTLREVCRAELAEAAAAFVVVGGDGMAHLGVELLADRDVPLGIVAAGTGNDLARGLGLPIGDIPAAIAALLDALRRGPRRIDAASIASPSGEVRGSFAGVLSAGFDAVVNERANWMRRPRGASRYVLALLRELVVLRPRRYELMVDGVSETVDALLVAVANNRSLGGGMGIVPDARLDDGMLDLFLVRPMGRIAFLRVFPRVFRGTHVNLPAVRIRRCRSVEIGGTDVIAYADGERIGALPLRIEVRPGALLVLA